MLSCPPVQSAYAGPADNPVQFARLCVASAALSHVNLVAGVALDRRASGAPGRWNTCGRVGAGYSSGMSAEDAVAVRTRYQARPGRRVIVVTDLASLRGPSRGTVELPLRLYWSGPSPVFDLDVPYLRRWLYQIVLREANRPEDLTSYLDRDTLIALWPELHLPRGVRQAWEEHHPQLRAAAAGAA
jgi:hypothetical protein